MQQPGGNFAGLVGLISSDHRVRRVRVRVGDRARRDQGEAGGRTEERPDVCAPRRVAWQDVAARIVHQVRQRVPFDHCTVVEAGRLAKNHGTDNTGDHGTEGRLAVSIDGIAFLVGVSGTHQTVTGVDETKALSIRATVQQIDQFGLGPVGKALGGIQHAGVLQLQGAERVALARTAVLEAPHVVVRVERVAECGATGLGTRGIGVRVLTELDLFASTVLAEATSVPDEDAVALHIRIGSRQNLKQIVDRGLQLGIVDQQAFDRHRTGVRSRTRGSLEVSCGHAVGIDPLVAAIEDPKVLLVDAPVAQGIPDSTLYHRVGIAARAQGSDDHVVPRVDVVFLQKPVHLCAVRYHALGLDHTVAAGLDPLARRRKIGEYVGAVGLDVFCASRACRHLQDDQLAAETELGALGRPVVLPALEGRGGDQSVDVLFIIVGRNLGDHCRCIHRDLARRRRRILTPAAALQA